MLQLFEKRVLWRIFESETDEVTADEENYMISF
jgi:hypothetical protein